MRTQRSEDLRIWYEIQTDKERAPIINQDISLKYGVPLIMLSSLPLSF